MDKSGKRLRIKDNEDNHMSGEKPNKLNIGS
jgi:hypothetical protein